MAVPGVSIDTLGIVQYGGVKMKYVVFSINDTEQCLPYSEFISYIPDGIYKAYEEFSGAGSQFLDDLLHNWNDYSPQNDRYCCHILSVKDEADLPYDTLCRDADVSRLLFAKYAAANFLKKDYTAVRYLIEKELTINKVFKLVPLDRIDNIDKQLEYKKQYTKLVLNKAKESYIDVLMCIEKRVGK